MKAIISFFSICFLTIQLSQAQNPASYFHAGAQAYINEDIQAAKINVENGLAMAPNDEKLIALKALLDKQQQQQKDQQQQDQEKKEEQKQEENQEQDSQESQDQQNQDKQDKQQDGQENQQQNQQNGEQQEKEGGEMKEMKMSKEQVEQMLQMLRQEEDKLQEKLQQVKARGKKKKLDKDW